MHMLDFIEKTHQEVRINMKMNPKSKFGLNGDLQLNTLFFLCGKRK